VSSGDLHEATPASDDAVALVHTADYVRKIKTGTLSVEEQLLLEVPFSPALRDASWLCAGGAIVTARLALQQRIAVHLGGGFHHAFPDHGEGFCLINDVAIAIRALKQETLIDRAAVVDLDVHHGNGTAAIFRNDPAVFTFSMHQEHNYPALKPPSDLDIGLDDRTGDAEYLSLLGQHLPEVFARHKPDLVFYLAGADPYQFDQLGGLGLTIAGLGRRDDMVFQCAGAGIAGGSARRWTP
jgi:acetoin utilization deacetylase AcuC-like enzyme